MLYLICILILLFKFRSDFESKKTNLVIFSLNLHLMHFKITLFLQNGGNHIVKHFQFTSWPDKHVPKFVTPLVEFHQFVRRNTETWPLLCHCRYV